MEAAVRKRLLHGCGAVGKAWLGSAQMIWDRTDHRRIVKRGGYGYTWTNSNQALRGRLAGRTRFEDRRVL